MAKPTTSLGLLWRVGKLQFLSKDLWLISDMIDIVSLRMGCSLLWLNIINDVAHTLCPVWVTGVFVQQHRLTEAASPHMLPQSPLQGRGHGKMSTGPYSSPMNVHISLVRAGQMACLTSKGAGKGFAPKVQKAGSWKLANSTNDTHRNVSKH